MTWEEFNINSTVRVKLTPLGHEIHRARHDRLKQTIEANGGRMSFSYQPPREDADRWSEWQLWVLMETFGSVMGLGCELPFETTIQIKGTL